jgi:hypothetical protein
VPAYYRPQVVLPYGGCGPYPRTFRGHW